MGNNKANSMRPLPRSCFRLRRSTFKTTTRYRSTSLRQNVRLKQHKPLRQTQKIAEFSKPKTPHSC
jgi:hypothetical protein